MFGAFNTFGKLGSPAGSRSLLAQIQSMGAGFIGIPSLSNYQDSAGTLLVTQPGGGSADPPVGLVLDLSQGAALGPELVVNGDFSSGATGWNTGAGWAVSAGAATHSGGLAGYLYQTGNLVVGRLYKITVTITATDGRGLYLIGAWWDPGPTIGATPGTYTVYAKAKITDMFLYANTDGTSITIDNISVRELKGNHATQSTNPARPKLSARVNLLTGTDTLSTQSVTVAAVAHTIFWTGAGTVTASGAYVGALTSGQTFTTTAGTLTLTVAGSVTSAQLNTGSTALRYQAVVDANTYDYSGFPFVHVFDLVDDAHVIAFPSSLGSACTVVTANRGTTPTIQTGQTIGTSYTISTTHAGKLIFPRGLTAGETAIVTAWATKQGAIA